jgi:hypothetical protein
MKMKNINFSYDQKSSSLIGSMAIFIVMCATRPAIAEQPVFIDVSRCDNIESAIERLTCYDELAGQARQTRSDLETSDLSETESDFGLDAPVRMIEQESDPPAADIQSTVVEKKVPVTEQTIEQTGRVTEENFGFPPEKRFDEKDLVELHSTVSKLKEYLPHRYLITLENGQIWRQMVRETYRLRVGHKVRIYPTQWSKNAFRLAAEGLKGSIQVERMH